MENVPSGSGVVKSSRSIIVTRNELFGVLQRDNVSLSSPSQCIKHLVRYVTKTYNACESEESQNYIRKTFNIFVKNCKDRWTRSRSIKSRFITKNAQWLQHHYEIPTKGRLIPGRPRKLFAASCDKTKSRDETVSLLLTAGDNEKLTYATQKSLHSVGKRTAAEVVKMTATATHRSLKRMKTAFSEVPGTQIKPYTPEESLALMVDLNLSKEKYITMQKGAKDRGANIYAAYSAVAAVKKQCYPEDDCITVTETEASIKLQSLLDITTRRLVRVQKDVLERIPPECNEINMIYKWGLDGSGGHSVYKINFADENIRHADSNIVFSNLVPLEMSGLSMNTDNKTIYWKNAHASATRNCRPIKFILQKETEDNVLQHYNEIKQQIDALLPTEVFINEKRILVNHIMLGTMFDGKILNILSNNSASQRCYICRALPKDMNNLKKILAMECNENYYDYGLSCLHAYIRTFEFFLHIAYKIDLRKWQARGPEAKLIVKERKDNICKKFYDEMGLVVDMPKQGGGNSNDGNSARRFFAEPEKVAEITGLDSNLIQRFSTILCTLASGFDIDVPKFRKYCLDTAELYNSFYNWYPMSVTVHKVLIHGADIIERMILPIGQLTEDVQESRQKDWKNMRLQHTRKTSRLNTNKDIINCLLVSSDPVITNARKLPRRKTTPFANDVLQLLKNPVVQQSSMVEETDNSSSDD